MRTRPLLPLVLLAALIARSRGWSQSAPDAAAAASEKPAIATTPALPALPEVAIKDDAAAHPVTATKGKDAAGHDTLSVDFPDTDIRDILRNVADLFELNLVIPETLQGKASIKLRDVSWHQIFQVILQPIGYNYIEEGNIIKIVSNESLAQEPVTTEVFLINYARAADILPTLQSLVTSTGSKIVVDARTNSLIITEAPSRMARIRPIIEQLDRATDQVMIESKFVDVTDTDIRNLGVNWASLSNYHVAVGPDPTGSFGSFTRQQGQTTSNGNNTTNGTTDTTGTTTTNTQASGSNTSTTVTVTNGVPNAVSTTGTTGTLGSNTTGTTGNTVSDSLNLLNSLANTGSTARTLNAVFTADQFGVVLSALNSLNTAKIISNPTVVTLNNTEATINIGQEYPIPSYSYNEQKGTFEISGFTYRPIGINLKVTPQVNARGFIKLTVEPEVSTQSGSVNFGGASGTSIPIIQTKKAKTQISLRDGSTMGIGGLIDTQINHGENKIPVLGSIPVLGYLFKQTTKNDTTRNLLIFLTAKTISAEGAPVGVIFDPRQVRSTGLKREDLPGYRDGSDPFGSNDPKAAKKSDKSAQ